MSEPPPIEELVALVRRLRAPGGCPWDQAQTTGDLRAYLLEEAHEVAAALDTGDWANVEAELGDLLFHVVFLAHLAEEAGEFDLSRVIRGITAKMVERHPHVFGEAAASTVRDVERAWERRKVERAPGNRSLLAGLPPSMPALLTAYRMTQKAAGVGFDWPDARAVLEKVDEELAELRYELSATESAPPSARVAEELGDLLFSLANLARHLGIDPEAALSRCNGKFRRRFEHIERGAREDGRAPHELSLDEMETLWREAKSQEP